MIALLATHGESLVAVQQGVASPGATLIGLYQGFRFGTERRSVVPFRSGTERNGGNISDLGTERNGTERSPWNGTERPFRSGGTSPFPFRSRSVPFRGTERNGTERRNGTGGIPEIYKYYIYSFIQNL